LQLAVPARGCGLLALVAIWSHIFRRSRQRCNTGQVRSVAHQQSDLGPVSDAQLHTSAECSHQLSCLGAAGQQPQVERCLEAEGSKRLLGTSISINFDSFQSCRDGCVAAELLCRTSDLLSGSYDNAS
jgi:hypothetical protein